MGNQSFNSFSGSRNHRLICLLIDRGILITMFLPVLFIVPFSVFFTKTARFNGICIFFINRLCFFVGYARVIGLWSSGKHGLPAPPERFLNVQYTRSLIQSRKRRCCSCCPCTHNDHIIIQTDNLILICLFPCLCLRKTPVDCLLCFFLVRTTCYICLF